LRFKLVKFAAVVDSKGEITTHYNYHVTVSQTGFVLNLSRRLTRQS